MPLHATLGDENALSAHANLRSTVHVGPSDGRGIRLDACWYASREGVRHSCCRAGTKSGCCSHCSGAMELAVDSSMTQPPVFPRPQALALGLACSPTAHKIPVLTRARSCETEAHSSHLQGVHTTRASLQPLASPLLTCHTSRTLWQDTTPRTTRPPSNGAAEGRQPAARPQSNDTLLCFRI